MAAGVAVAADLRREVAADLHRVDAAEVAVEAEAVGVAGAAGELPGGGEAAVEVAEGGVAWAEARMLWLSLIVTAVSSLLEERRTPSSP